MNLGASKESGIRQTIKISYIAAFCPLPFFGDWVMSAIGTAEVHLCDRCGYGSISA